MKQILFCCFIIFSMVNCKVENRPENINKETVVSEEKDTFEVIEIKEQETESIQIESVNLNEYQANYRRLKSQITAKKRTIKNRADINQAQKIQLAQTYTTDILIDSMFQYWRGTEWDFNGYTAKPRNGLIACGYFVSTTLLHTGFELNRYKIAQKAAAEIIDALCDTSSIKVFSSLSAFESYLENVPDREILVLGLDFHVGFVFRENNQNYFAHSNYIDRAGVMIERFEDSEALKNTNSYYIGNFTSNKAFFENWLR